ncbi:MAG: branched-chain amino acid ABC transporter [Pseudomonadota bacterium]
MKDTIEDFDLGAADAQDEATLAIKHPTTDKPTTWVWSFYGPGHPNTVALADRVSKQALRELYDRQQSRLNGKKVKVDEKSLEELRAEQVDSIVQRTKSFTPVKLGAETITFTPDAARDLLLDRKKGWLYKQVTDFLAEDASFIQPSGKT